MTAPATAPRIPLAPLPVLDEIDGRLITRNDERDREQYRDADLTGYDRTASLFTECDFAAVTLDDAELRGARFVECRITDSFAPSLSAARTTWREVVIVNPRWWMWTSDRRISQQ